MGRHGMKKDSRSKPDSGNPTVRDCRGAPGNVVLEGLTSYSDGKEYKKGPTAEFAH